MQDVQKRVQNLYVLFSDLSDKTKEQQPKDKILSVPFPRLSLSWGEAMFTGSACCSPCVSSQVRLYL